MWARSCALVLVLLVAPPLLAGEASPASPDDAPGSVDRLLRQAHAAEIAGDVKLRAALLDRAVALDPDHTAAHWQRGDVIVDGQWLSAVDAERKLGEAPDLVEYRRLRDEARLTPADHSRLARWCQQKGLVEQTRLHDAIAFQLNPQDRALQKRLGLRRFRGALLAREQIDAILAQEKHQADSLKHWKGRLTELRKQLASKDAAVREQAAAAVASITDPSVLPALEAILCPAEADAALAAARLLGSFDTPATTEALARQAVLTPYDDVRKEIAAQLKQRPLHGWVPLLLSAMQVPIEVQVQLMGTAGSPAFALSLFRTGPFAEQFASYTDVPAPVLISDMRGDPNVAREQPLIVNTRPDLVQARAQAQAAYAGQVVAAAESFNRSAALLNQRISATLSAATGRDGEADPNNWYHWWYDYNEYSYARERPLATSATSTSYNFTTVDVQPPPQTLTLPPMRASSSCFLAGTLVATWTGPRPIESIRVGDSVLSQDIETGELAYKPVIGTTHGPPTPMIKLSLGDGDLYLTRGHPLWVPGQGWRMPKELKPGDLLHTLDGPVALQEVIDWAEAETFNLVVADYSTYFVTDRRLLAHDITFRRPTTAVLPGVPRDAPAKALADTRP
ncbi:MAG: polymorphic toxin-type HINT domain-containing protein [Pirellulales bacterium]